MWAANAFAKSLFVRSQSLDRDLDMCGRSMFTGFVADRSLDIQNLKGVKGQVAVMALRVGQTGDCVEDGLIDAFARSDCHGDMLML
jgi:hypothetical protein